ncbi:MAG: hypothetical protein ABFE07_28330 [Armatimonadia bacterium]
MIIKTTPFTGEQVAKRIFWLAWQACGGPLGAGWLQNHPEATEADVWQNVCTNGDYPGNPSSRPGDAYGDYVFGRMMKLTVLYKADEVALNDERPRGDYQAWCRQYRTYEELAKAALTSLEMEKAHENFAAKTGG